MIEVIRARDRDRIGVPDATQRGRVGVRDASQSGRVSITDVRTEPEADASLIDNSTKVARDRIIGNGWDIRDGLTRGLMDLLIRKLKDQGHFSDLVYLGAAGARERASGSIATLPDWSGRKNDATQSDPAKRPAEDTGSIGGRVGAVFDEDDDLLDSPASAEQPNTHIWVAKTPCHKVDRDAYVFDGTDQRQAFYTNDSVEQRAYARETGVISEFSDTNVRSGAVLFDGESSKAELADETASLDPGGGPIDSLRLGARTAGSQNLGGPLLMHLLIDASTARTERDSLREITQDYYSL